MAENHAHYLALDGVRPAGWSGAGVIDGADIRLPSPGGRSLACGRSFAARLRLLGRFSLSGADGGDATPASAKVRALLAVLALSPDGSCDRGRLAGLLWSESADAKTSLRQCVKELRATLARAGLTLLGADPRGLTLDLSRLWVDALELQRLARQGVGADPELLAGLYAGDLLADVAVRDPSFQGWLAVERPRLQRMAGDTLEAVLEDALDRGDADRTERAARALLALEPAHEEAHRALIRHHGLRGDVLGAIRQYEACRDALARELDLAPAGETEALLAKVRAGGLRREIVARPPVHSSITVMTARAAPHASVAVDEKAPATGDAADAAVVVALAAAVREALSRKRWLSVLDAPVGGIVMAGEPARQAADPAYRVGVSCVRLGDRIRFLAELKDGASARILWAEHHDRRFGQDIFDIVDALAGSLARRLDREVELAEIARASRQPVEALSPRDCVLRAIPLIFKLTPKSFRGGGAVIACRAGRRPT